MSEPNGKELRNLIELARERGFDVLEFLSAVVEGRHLAIGESRPIPLSLRIAAADLIRKFASLPSNVSLELDTKRVLIYRGDEGVAPLPGAPLPPDAPDFAVKPSDAAAKS